MFQISILIFLTVVQKFIAFLPTQKSSSQFLNISDNEFSSLFDLYSSTAGNSWRWNGVGDQWNFSAGNEVSPCSWQGIECMCSMSVCRVQTLNLSNFGMIGPLPSSTAGFPYLKQLILDDNELSGPFNFVQFLSHTAIENMTMISLSKNRFSGTLNADWTALSGLEWLMVDGNYFSGAVPEVFPESLRVFHAEDNYLSRLPAINLPSRLEEFHLQYNVLYDAVTEELFGNCYPSLMSVNILGNYLWGPFLQSLSQCANLRSLSMGMNYFSGGLHYSAFFTVFVLSCVC